MYVYATDSRGQEHIIGEVYDHADKEGFNIIFEESEIDCKSVDIKIECRPAALKPNFFSPAFNRWFVGR